MSDDQDTTNNTHHHQYQDNDAGVSQFLAITGSTDMAQATSFLDMSGGSLDTAIALFFEHRGSGVSGSAGMPPLPHHDTDDSVRAPDATRSMRLMDHDHHAHDGFHAPFASSAAASLASFVAANEQQQQEALLLASSAFEASSSNSVLVRHVVNQHAAAAAAASLVQRHDTHGDDDDDYVYMQDDSDDNDDDGEDSNNNNNNNVSSTTDTQNNNLLQHMFAPPTHLLHTAGGFQGARAVAKDSRRWLLVNIQRNEEFSSHALNRDVWRDELVENLVREGFIFWQTMDVTPDGRTYVERYQVRHFPHVAILDPRTGRLVWRKEGWTQQHALTAMDFAEYAMDFCSKHSFDKPPFVGTLSKNNNNNMNGTSGGGGTNGGTKRPMTEQEQLQEAVRASLKPTDSSSSSNGDGDDDVDDDHHVEYLGTTTTTTTSNEPLTAASMSFEPATTTKPSGTASSSTTTTTRPTNEFLIMAVGEEPDDGARIQFRMPDAKRLVRKFASDRPVKILYAFVAQSIEEAQGGREFCLKAGYPPKDLAGSMDDTIGSCKLSGQAVTVRWKES